LTRLALATAAVLTLTSLAACGSSDKTDDAGTSAGADAPASEGAGADAATPPDADAPAPAPVTLVQAGKLTVCTNPPFAPFEDTVEGEIVGFDIDITGEVAKDLGVPLNVVTAPFEGLQSGVSLDVGDCDIAASGITITPERQAKVDFAEPYFESTQGLLVRADSGIKELSDLTGKKVAVQQATTGEVWAEEQPELDNILQFEDLGLQINSLRSGEVEAVINDLPTLTPYIDDEFIVANDFVTGENYGLAIKKGNAELLAQANASLARIRSDGTYDALYSKWISPGAGE
jgi:polar amino acid transport system substrate-binding protein